MKKLSTPAMGIPPAFLFTRERSMRRAIMKIRVAIASSIVALFLCLSPLIANAKDEKPTTVPTPNPHGKCVSECEATYNKCRNASPKDGAALRACNVTRMECRNVLCADLPSGAPAAPPK